MSGDATGSSDVSWRRTAGSPKPCERQGDRAIIVSRGGHVPPGRTRRSSTGQRMAGETELIDSGLQGRTLRKSSLIPTSKTCFSGKRCARKRACIVWEGGNGKGLAAEPRRYPTSFGEGRLETCRKVTRWPSTLHQGQRSG